MNPLASINALPCTNMDSAIAIRLPSKTKLIQNLKFEMSKGYCKIHRHDENQRLFRVHYKYKPTPLHSFDLKSLTMVGRLCRISAFSRSLKQHISLEDVISRNPKQLHKALKPCKYIKKIEAFSIKDPFFKTLRLFQNVQIITISISEDQIVQNHSIVKSWRHLRHLNVTLHGGRKETSDAAMVLRFFHQLLRASPPLLNLKLDLINSKTFQSGSNLKNLLLNLRRELSSFKIQAKLKDDLEFSSLGKLLPQVELLVLQFLAKEKNTDYYLTHEATEWVRDNRLLDQVNQAMDLNSKSLRIMFKTRPTINFETLFSQCTSLKSLCLQWRHYQPINFSRLKNLKNIMLGFQALRDSEFEPIAKQLAESFKEISPLEGFHFLVENSILSEVACRKLLKLHQLSCFKKLKHYIIEIFDEESSKLKKVHNSNSRFCQALIQQQQFSSLESLRLYFGGATALCWKNIQNLLGSLHSLQKLELAIFSSIYSEIELYLPFESLPKLQELRLGFIGPLKRDCAQNLADNLPSLHKLKILDITEGCLENLNVDSFGPLVQSFRDLRQIKALTLRVPRKLDESLRSSDEAVNKIEKEAFELFETNCHIEILNILFNKNYQFDIKHSR